MMMVVMMMMMMMMMMMIINICWTNMKLMCYWYKMTVVFYCYSVFTCLFIVITYIALDSEYQPAT